jgi:hypothetical protein
MFVAKSIISKKTGVFKEHQVLRTKPVYRFENRKAESTSASANEGVKYVCV